MVMFHSYVSLPEGRAQVCFQIQILLGCFGLSKGLTIDVPSVSHFIPFGLPGLTTTPVAPLVHVTRDDFDDHCHLAFQDVSNIYIYVCVTNMIIVYVITIMILVVIAITILIIVINIAITIMIIVIVIVIVLVTVLLLRLRLFLLLLLWSLLFCNCLAMCYCYCLSLLSISLLYRDSIEIAIVSRTQMPPFEGKQLPNSFRVLQLLQNDTPLLEKKKCRRGSKTGWFSGSFQPATASETLQAGGFLRKIFGVSLLGRCPGHAPVAIDTQKKKGGALLH